MGHERSRTLTLGTQAIPHVIYFPKVQCAHNFWMSVNSSSYYCYSLVQNFYSNSCFYEISLSPRPCPAPAISVQVKRSIKQINPQNTNPVQPYKTCALESLFFCRGVKMDTSCHALKIKTLGLLESQAWERRCWSWLSHVYWNPVPAIFYTPPSLFPLRVQPPVTVQ